MNLDKVNYIIINVFLYNLPVLLYYIIILFLMGLFQLPRALLQDLTYKYNIM